MAPINRTANSHHTSLIVSGHVPEFVRADHPTFVTFLEKYYEFAANNSLIETSDGSGTYYYGFDSGAKILQDLSDVDRTDFDNFVESFRKQYAYSFPDNVYSEVNRATLYKNLVQFYQSVGTEDSFRALFRLLYNEEIEIYYPGRDVLVASGGNYAQGSRLKVYHTDNINLIENKKIVGASSGAYATVESVEVLPPGNDDFVVGKIPNATTITSGASGNTQIHDNRKLLEHARRTAFVYLSDVTGNFKLYEDLYYMDGSSTNTSVSNTSVLPQVKRIVLYEPFVYHAANSVVSLTDARKLNPTTSNNPPWGTSNIAFANTGVWYLHGPGTGEIQVTGNVSSSVFGQRVLRIGNNDITDATAYSDMRHLIYSGLIGISNPNNVYRMSVRARDLGGNSAFSVANGNRFSAGVVAYRHDLRPIGSDSYANTYDNPFWFVSHKQSIDDNFYNYVGYFGGVEDEKTAAGPYDSTSYGNGGRIDLPTGEQNFNSIKKAVERKTQLPFNTAYFAPTIKVNEPGGSATYSQGITEIDSIILEEMTVLQTQEGNRPGYYRPDSGSLLSESSVVQDGYYWQQAAYDIRTKQQMGTTNGYATIVRDTVHPAGMKMFGTKLSESGITITTSTENHLNDTFSPDQLDSLAGWWRADAIGPKNVEYRRYGDATSNGTFGTERNRFPVAFGNFEDLDEDYNIRSHLEDLIAKGSDDVYIGKRSLKIIDDHTNPYPTFDIPINSEDNNLFLAAANKNMNDDVHHPIIIEPNKKWLFSFYSKVSSLLYNIYVSPVNSFYMITSLANTSGGIGDVGSVGATGNGSVNYAYFNKFDAKDTWQRMAMVLDLTAYESTRIGFRIGTAAHTLLPGTTEYHFDGFMLEEYDPDQHGTVWGQHTPSPYIETGLSGSNVISWFDQSVNRHHVYANTHGGLFYYPQYVANAINGKPAVRFSANTVKNTGNVYQYSSIGGSVDSTALEAGTATNFKPPTSGFQSKITGNTSGGYLGGTLSSPSLPRPVANSWTVLAVVRTNLALNAVSYDTALHPTIINSGYAGNEDALSDSASASGTLNLGYEIIGETGAIQADVVNSSAGFTSINSAAVATFDNLSSANTEHAFRIVGVSVNASTLSASSTEDLINFHIDGRRFGNSEIHSDVSSFVSGHSGMDWRSQNNYVTSIGKWAPANAAALITDSVRSVYPYGTKDWDGDIAEILVFNEKLSNNNIAKVEGYLAHKYGLESNLKHKDDNGSGSPEIELRRDEFDGTLDGWDFYVERDGVRIAEVTKDLTTPDYVVLTAGSWSGDAANLVMTKTFDTPFDGAAYHNFTVKFNRQVGFLFITQEGFLTFTDVDNVETSLYNQKLDYDFLSLQGYTHLNELDGVVEWDGKKIKKLKYSFGQDADGQVQIAVYYALLSGNSHPHPYGEYAPLTESSNSWNLNY